MGTALISQPFHAHRALPCCSIPFPLLALTGGIFWGPFPTEPPPTQQQRGALLPVRAKQPSRDFSPLCQRFLSQLSLQDGNSPVPSCWPRVGDPLCVFISPGTPSEAKAWRKCCQACFVISPVCKEAKKLCLEKYLHENFQKFWNICFHPGTSTPQSH